MSNLPKNFSSLASSSDGTKIAGCIENYGIYLSTNSGYNWLRVPDNGNNGLSGLQSITTFFKCITSSADGSKLAVATGNIYVSSNSGITWSLGYTSNDYMTTFVSMTSSADGTKLAAIKSEVGVFISSDSGLTWSLSNNIDMSGKTLSSITSSSDGTKIYVLSSFRNVSSNYGKTIYVSLDSGLTWSTISTPDNSSATYKSIAISGDGTKLALTFYTPGAGGIYLSSNGGNTWSSSSAANDLHVNFNLIKSNYDGTKLLATNSNYTFNNEKGGIYLSINSGNSWQYLSNVSQNSQEVPRDQTWKSITGNSDFTKIVASFSTPAYSPGMYRDNTGTFIYVNQGWYAVSSVDGTVMSSSNSSTSNLVCFKKDSQILTSKGYVAIQNLKKGDLVKTIQNGFVPIYNIGFKEIYNPSVKERIKDQLYVCSKKKYPDMIEDLVITGCHSILVDDFKEGEKEETEKVLGFNYVTDYKYRLPACVDKRADIYGKTGNFTIYHIALENDDYYMNYGIFANGLLVETCSKRYLEKLSDMTIL